MSEWEKFDLHLGLSALDLPDEPIEMGRGIVLRKTFARFGAPFMLINTAPELTPPSPAPVPRNERERRIPLPPLPPPPFWHLERSEFDVVAELHVPRSERLDSETRYRFAYTILLLLRLIVAPGLTFHVLSTQPFAALIPRGLRECALVRMESNKRTFTFGIDNTLSTTSGIEWIAKHWEVVARLYDESPEFRLAVLALDAVYFVPDSALALVSLWGAIEALFAPSHTELKFRVSALLASYLEPPGAGRLALQRFITKLYDKRSAAVHGKPKHATTNDLTGTFELLRRVVIRITDAGVVPTKESLEANLFGASA